MSIIRSQFGSRYCTAKYCIERIAYIESTALYQQCHDSPRTGCHLYGKLRQSDFLPVGIDRDDEVWERGDDSMNSGDSEYEGGHVRGDLDDADNSDSESEYECGEVESTALNTPSADTGMYNPAFDADFAF